MMTQQSYSRLLSIWYEAWHKPLKSHADVDIVPDTPKYRKWLKKNEQKHKDRVDLSKGVVFKGSVF